MKVKVGQKIRIGKTPACRKALSSFYLDTYGLESVLGRLAVVQEITTFNEQPAVHLTFRTTKPIKSGSIKDPNLFYPVAALRKP